MTEPIKVLVVDDIEQNLVVLQALLERPGLELLCAHSGAEALELLLTHSVALALLDVHMPAMDGFELAELMRGSPRTRHVPIIFLTATDRNAMRTFRGYDAGAVDFLYKPFDPHILRSKVEVFVKLFAGQRQLAEQNAALQDALRMNDMFVAVLGHDLRNPLAAMMNLAEIVHRVGESDKVRSAGQRISQSGLRMARLIEQMLDLAMVRAGRVTLTPTTTDMRELCTEIIAEFGSAHPTRSIELECIGATRGQWDADRLGQVLSNLIGNALQYGADGTIHVTVDGSMTDSLRMRVSNAGQIAQETLERLFEPFERGENDRQRSGYGLGLFIVHELVTLHRGTVGVHSQGGLTTFEVVLPRQAPGGMHAVFAND